MKIIVFTFLVLFVESCIYYTPNKTHTIDELIASSEKNIELDDLATYPKPISENEQENRQRINSEIPIPEIELLPDEILTRTSTSETNKSTALNNSLNLEQYENHPKVQKWLKYYTGKGREQMQRHLERGHYYKSTFLKLLEQQGLPSEFYFMALIESGFRPSAVSSAKAVGIWQFISGTAKRYGLRIDGYVDERKDPIRATLAASSYLSDLNNVFNSWFLAMAAYNAGESRILNLILRYKTRNYWDLSDKAKFPKETSNYVPKFIAAYLVGNNIEKYNFTEPYSQQMPELVSISLPSPIRIDDIAFRLKIPIESIKKNNPHLHSNITPAYIDTYRLWFEKKYSNDHFISQLEGLNVLPRKSLGPGYYRIQRGDTLIKIAKKFGISVRTLKLMNNTRSDRIIAGRKIRISSSVGHKTPETKKYFRYVIKKGDSLFSLAKKYKTSVNHLKKINSLKSSRIYIGQKIKIGS